MILIYVSDRHYLVIHFNSLYSLEITYFWLLTYLWLFGSI